MENVKYNREERMIYVEALLRVADDLSHKIRAEIEALRDAETNTRIRLDTNGRPKPPLPKN